MLPRIASQSRPTCTVNESSDIPKIMKYYYANLGGHNPKIAYLVKFTPKITPSNNYCYRKLIRSLVTNDYMQIKFN